MDKRSRLSIWSDAAFRYLVANTLSGVLPIYVITEYPKCGGTWVGQMVSDYLQLPFPRNRWIPVKASVHHAHYVYTPSIRNTLAVFRDGRDVMVSFYFHMMFENEKSSPHVVHKTRKALKFADYNDVHSNLPTFIEYLFDIQSKSRSPFQFTWPEFVRSFEGKPGARVRYEELVEDCPRALSAALADLTGQQVDMERVEAISEKYSFKAQANRPAGVEKKGSFLRKGRPGDWQEKFTPEAARLFHELAGAELIKLGYVRDGSWVDSLS
ncbi:MAG: sulfotransferase domain-containing protein [Pseudomonadota bacterium]